MSDQLDLEQDPTTTNLTDDGLPPGWAAATLEDVLMPLEDGRLLHHGWSPRCHPQPSPSDEEWGVLKTTAIQDGEFQPEHNKHLPDDLAPRPHLEVQQGDLLITCAGPRARCGVPCYVRRTRPKLILSGKMYRFRVPPDELDPLFMEGWLRTPTAQAAIDRMKTGISDSGLNLTHSRFLPLRVPVAPLPEQHRIVEAIESYLTRLDDAVATLERVQRNLKRYRASVLKAAVEGRLVPTEAELARTQERDFEPASVLLERILTQRRRRWEESELAKGKRPKNDKWKAKYKEPATPDTTDLPELPDGWCWASVEQLGFVASGQTPKGVTTAGAPTGDVPWFRVGDMNTEGNETHMRVGKDWLTHEQVAALGLHVRPPGTILFPKRGGAIKTNKKRLLAVPSAYDLNTMGIVPVPPIGSYLWMWFIGLDLGPLADGSNVPQLNHGDIAPLPVPLPPLHEQGRIVEEVERMLSIEEDTAHVAFENAQRATRLRQAVLKWAFEGKLADQDPNDEPAAVLLERIQAERAKATTKKSNGRGRKKREKA